uniref:Dual specificity protein kinase TTK n=1 Tax=Neolamprologus brichardi TaxID=32507 RepID=A0A3Q4GNH4_NEOBR
MEEEEHTDRKQKLAMLYQKLNKIKKYLNEDDTDNINQVIGSNSPESCLSYLMDLEKKGDPHLDSNHLTRLIDFYTRVFSNMPLGKHCHNESYARMLVRFAELKAIQDVSEAEDNFNVARSHSQNFAFVHIAHAQFEISQGNAKRGIYILQNAVQVGAQPKEQLEAALRSIQNGKAQLWSSKDKENLPGEHSCLSCVIIYMLLFDLTPARVPIVPFSIPEKDDDDDYNNSRVSKGSDASIPTSLSRYVYVYLFWLKCSECRPWGGLSVLLFKCIIVSFFFWRIEDPDEAEDHFIVARSNCKAFAFVHIAHAQFEVSQGNVDKATSILHKAHTLNAKPAELLDMAIHNLKAGEKRLLPTNLQASAPIMSACGGIQEVQLPARVPVRRSVEQPKPASREPLSEWKIPTSINRHVSPEMSHSACLYLSPLSFITPVVKRGPEVSSSAAAAHRAGPAQQPCTPLNQTLCAQTPQASLSVLSNESITIKGKQFFILKMIGRGGSSKVYQVLDHKKQLYAVKYVNLEEADAQTIESYKNEIEHLNHLQQYSDQIVKLYDYEITNSYIYMLMECGNLDLNTWLRNRKTVNLLERKFYWKNMLEAVHTIHKHGIIHSDLKPANFVIVNASLKLIDFGIANRIQPDVTSIMKDSQVGTLNYMPPEAIKDTSSQTGKARSKISPKGDVWSLGCILYCMTYGKTPFQSITNQISKLHAIIDPSHKIEFPDISEKDLLDVLKRCLVRNPRERISIAELLEHPYLQLKPQASPEPEYPSNNDLKKILTDLAALQSPNSIIRAANNLARMCSSGRKLDVAECAKSSS